MSEALTWIALFGLAGISVLTRSFFMIGEKPLPIPDWLRELLKVAPLAALVAVVAPEIFMTQGQLISTTGYFFWRRDILGTIVSGMAVMLTLKLGLGW
jgi:branched-subunit amino acid transport protein